MTNIKYASHRRDQPIFVPSQATPSSNIILQLERDPIALLRSLVRAVSLCTNLNEYLLTSKSVSNLFTTPTVLFRSGRKHGEKEASVTA
jgi:hypothetical protein